MCYDEIFVWIEIQMPENAATNHIFISILHYVFQVKSVFTL